MSYVAADFVTGGIPLKEVLLATPSTAIRQSRSFKGKCAINPRASRHSYCRIANMCLLLIASQKGSGRIGKTGTNWDQQRRKRGKESALATNRQVLSELFIASVLKWKAMLFNGGRTLKLLFQILVCGSVSPPAAVPHSSLLRSFIDVDIQASSMLVASVPSQLCARLPLHRLTTYGPISRSTCRHSQG